MPVTQSAKQALRKDRRRAVHNLRRKRVAKQAVDAAQKQPTLKNLQQAVSQLDKLAKHHIIHPRKADRLKSNLARQVNQKSSSVTKSIAKKSTPTSKTTKSKSS